MHLFALLACVVSKAPNSVAPSPAPSAATWEEVLAKPGVIEVESLISARWEVPLSGLVNLDRPAARQTGLIDGVMKMVLPVHVLRHRPQEHERLRCPAISRPYSHSILTLVLPCFNPAICVRLYCHEEKAARLNPLTLRSE